MCSLPHIARRSLLPVGLLGLTAVLLLAAPANAQPSERQRVAPSPNVPGATVPDWAESEAPLPSPGSPPSARPKNTVPAPPSSPSQAPVDGGLGWLAAAGAAYAISRLRRRSESTDV